MTLPDQAPSGAQPIDSDQGLAAHLPGWRADPGPIALDTERASGFRYVQRAYLIQLKTASCGTALIDPLGLSEAALADLAGALADKEWILHAASQDLPALAMAGLRPDKVFDTELSARLLGRERVGLGPLVEQVLGVALAKDHANSDWSTRPLPAAWLDYAAADVEYLIELAAALRQELIEADKLHWAEQECAWLLAQPDPEPRPDPWRSTTDIHLVRTRRGLAAVRALWLVRDRLAQAIDLAPHKVVNDRAIAGLAAQLDDHSARGAIDVPRHWGRAVGADHLVDFRDALAEALALPTGDLPPLKAPRRQVSAPGTWGRTNPAAAKRWQVVRPAVKALAEAYHVPVENLISPKPLRALLWRPDGSDATSLDAQLASLGARAWQRDLVVPVIADALTAQADPTEQVTARPQV